MWQMMVEKEMCKQQSPFDQQNYSNNKPFFFFVSTHSLPPLPLTFCLSFPFRFWSVVIPLRLVLFRFVHFHGMEQYPPHALPPPCSCSPRRTFWPWCSLSQSPGVWRIFSTSSSKAHWTPSLVFALASAQRKEGKIYEISKKNKKQTNKLVEHFPKCYQKKRKKEKEKQNYTSAFKSKTEKNIFLCKLQWKQSRGFRHNFTYSRDARRRENSLKRTKLQQHLTM